MAVLTNLQCSACFFTSDDMELFFRHDCVVNSGNVAPPMGTVEDLLQQASTSFVGESAKATLQKWEDRFVLLLLKKYGEYKHLFGKPKTGKIGVFEKIASAFSEAADVVVSGEQCMRKWLKLEAKYKEVEDNNKNQTWKFHEQIAECIGDFLQSYTEKKEKVEEEKIKLLREMQQKKDEFFSQFLDVLKKK